MKNVILFCTMLFCIFTSCKERGVASKIVNGNEETLPDELKGLKIYTVSVGCGNYVKVAVLNDKINSTTYGKHQQSTIIINKQSGNLIEVKEILMENDSLIVCRK